MGTTLTGTTPQDTYDSLIKVTDNGPLSGTLKKLTDGLGNDSSLSLSTTAASLSGTLAVTGATTLSSTLTGSGDVTLQGGATRNLKFLDSTNTNLNAQIQYDQVASNSGQLFFGTNNAGTFATRLTITSAGNVGIGTSAPNVQLEVSAADNSLGGIFRLNNNRTSLFDGDQNGSIQFSNNEASGGASGVRSAILSLVRDAAGKTDLAFTTASSNGATSEKVRILADGGLTFNGDTAAANALDDYEEGTWTMGVSFGGASVGVTYAANTGTYTKIGRQVTVNGLLTLSSKGSSTGSAAITGLPFTVPNADANYSAASLKFNNLTFANQYQGFARINTTTIDLEEITELGAVSSIANTDFANNTVIVVGLTYFV